MRKSVLLVVGVAAAIIIIGFMLKKGGGGGVTSNVVSTDSGSNSDNSTDRKTNSSVAKAKPKPKPTLPDQIVSGTNDGTVSSRPATGLTNWEEKLEEVLNSETPEPDKAKKLIELFPQLNDEGKEEVAHHISNLTPDENYSLGQFLTNSALPEAVLDVFTEDVLNRPNGIKLPLLLDVARDPQHPKAGEAKDILELFLEEDFGTDWSKWQGKLNQWLKDNPD